MEANSSDSIKEVLKEPIAIQKPEEETQVKRIATLDFFRGLSIFFMIFFHLIYHNYDYSWITDYNQLLSLPIYLIIPMGIAAFLGSWHDFFLFISAIVNSYVIVRRYLKTQNTIRTLLQQILVGGMLIFFGWLEQAFGYWGYFGLNIMGINEWTDFSIIIVAFFRAETLQIIGLSLIINGILLHFLLRNKGYEKYKRNMLIYFALIILVLVITEVLRFNFNDFYLIFSGNINMEIIHTWMGIYGSFGTWILAVLLGGLLPSLPFLATAFVGTMLGLTIARPSVNKKHPLFGFLIGLALLILGVIYTIINIKLGLRWTTIEVNPSISTYLIRIGCQLILICLCLYFVEFKGRGAKLAKGFIIKHMRFWGIISLTLYMLQIFELFPRWILTIVFKSQGINFLPEQPFGKGSELIVAFVVVISMLAFYYLLAIWSKINFVGSFEWLIYKMQVCFFKAKKQKLNVDQQLNKVIWIDFSGKDKAPIG